MLHTTRTSRLAPALVAGLLALAALSACGTDDDPAAGSGDTSSSSGSSAGTGDGSGKGDSGEDPAGDGSGPDDAPGSDGGDSGGSGDGAGGDPGTDEAGGDPNSPFVVAAAAVGTRSRDQVITLHAMGFSTTHDSGVPHQALPDQGAVIHDALEEQVKAATQMTPPKGSPAAKLVASLTSYGELAEDLAGWNPDGAPLPPSWFTRIAATDKTWTQAMQDLSDLSDNDLLADMPELLMPAST